MIRYKHLLNYPLFLLLLIALPHLQAAQEAFKFEEEGKTPEKVQRSTPIAPKGLVSNYTLHTGGYVKEAAAKQKQAALKAQSSAFGIRAERSEVSLEKKVAFQAQINQNNTLLQEKAIALQKLHKQITALEAQIDKKDETLQIQQEQYSALQTQSEEKEETIAALKEDSTNRPNVIRTKNQEIDHLTAKLQEKDSMLQHYYQQQQQQQISTQIIKVNKLFSTQIPAIDISNANAIKAFVQQVNLEFQPLFEIRALHAKYKGGTENDNKGWKEYLDIFGRKIKSDEGLYWDDLYNEIKKKLKYCTQVSGKFSIFFKIIQHIDTVLPNNNSRLYGVKQVLEKTRTKEATYQVEIAKLNNKLKPLFLQGIKPISWRWLN